MRIFIKLLLATASILAPAIALPAEDQVVFSGSPISKVESDSTSTSRFELSLADVAKYVLLITMKDGKYYWASPENRELKHFRSGAFHWFISESSGYIKLVDRRLLLDEENPQYLYMEHLTLHLGTITYWGTGENFAP
jgi:hypothetical protein